MIPGLCRVPRGAAASGSRAACLSVLRPGAPPSPRRPLTIGLRLPIHQGDPVRLAAGALDVQGALGAAGAEHGRVHLDGGAVRREDLAEQGLHAAARLGRLLLPRLHHDPHQRGGRASVPGAQLLQEQLQPRQLREERRRAAQHQEQLRARRPDAVSSAAETGVPGRAPGASRGSSALGPEHRGFLLKRLDFVAGQSSRFIELSPERLGRRAVQLLALVWPLLAAADEGPGSCSASASTGKLCRLGPSSSCFQSSLISSTWPWPSTDWAGACGCASAFLSWGALQRWAPGRCSMSGPAPSPLWTRASVGRENVSGACHNTPEPYLFLSWPSTSAPLFLGNPIYRKLLLDAGITLAVFSFSIFYFCGFKMCILLYHG